MFAAKQSDVPLTRPSSKRTARMYQEDWTLHFYEVFRCAHLHINLLKKESKLAKHVQILKRRN